jgi:D-alanyl-D-alanine carboxypeptidase
MSNGEDGMMLRRRTKLTLGAVLVLVLVFNFAVPSLADGPDLESDYYVLMDASSGQVLYSKNMNEEVSPAGLIKIMTALIAIESQTTESQFNNEQLSVTATALAPLTPEIRNIRLAAGELIDLSDCLYAMLLVSANDAANVVAESVGGSLDNFVTMMNTKAAELNLQNTLFKNPNGLTAEGQKSSPYDIALTLKAALANPTFMGFFAKTVHTIEPTNIFREDRIIKTTCLMNRSSDYYYEGSTGGMIGYTSASKYVIAATASREGRQLIAVVMKSESEVSTYKDARALLDYGFSDFTEFEFSTQDLAASVPLTENGVKIGEARFTINDTIRLLLRNDYDETKVIAVAEDLPTAIPKGSETIYHARIVYKPQDGAEIILKEKVPLVMTTILDPVPTSPSTTSPGIIVTDKDGNPVTDEHGNVVTMPGGEKPGGGFLAGVGKFFRMFFIILLIIIAAIAGLVLLFIGVLFIIKYVKRYKRRKARERARKWKQ